MALLNLNVTIQNQTSGHLTLKSAQQPLHVPTDIPPGTSPQFGYSSWWGAITNNVVYTTGDQNHEVELTWYVQAAGGNSYTANVTPTDGAYSASADGEQGYHVSVTYTVSQA